MEKRTIESIISDLKRLVESKTPISAEQFIDAALFLEILKFDENQKYLALDSRVAQKRIELRKETKSVADAELQLKATQEWRDFQEQKLKMETIQEFVRIAKKQSEIRKI